MKVREKIESVLSLGNRPFQEAKFNGRTICCECHKESGEIKFFLEDAGLRQHFRVRHRGTLDEKTIKVQCRMLFQDLHGQETTVMMKRLSELRFQTVRMLDLNSKHW